jgi:hypothetical protein
MPEAEGIRSGPFSTAQPIRVMARWRMGRKPYGKEVFNPLFRISIKFKRQKYSCRRFRNVQMRFSNSDTDGIKCGVEFKKVL